MAMIPLAHARIIEGKYLNWFFPATYYIQERVEYSYEPGEGVDGVLINGQLHGPWIPGTNIFRVCIEHGLGLTSLQPVKHGAPVGQLTWVEVYSYKFPTFDEHWDFYKSLVDDLFRQAANLPFNFRSVTQRGVDESTRPPTPLFTYFFLKEHLAKFTAAIETILAEPHRLLCDYPELVPLAQATEVDGDVILSIFQSPDTWVETNNISLSRALKVNNKHYAPQQVWQRQPEETFNTPENRFILHFLRQVLMVAEKLIGSHWWPLVASLPRSRAIFGLIALLRQTVTHPMFDEVGELYHIPFNSQVLMRREGYHDLMVLWQEFHSARSPLFDAWQHAMDVRAMNHLYEIWVFFELVELSGPCKILDISITDERGLEEHSMEYEAKAIFEDGSQLYYNPTFHPSYKRSFYSYSMVLRPDYYWIDASHQRKVVLDAKFSLRVEEIELDQDEESEFPAIMRVSYPVRENLYKMHTYRDALTGTQAAVVIYPGTTSVFMPLHGSRIKDLALKNCLFSGLNGVGAISLRPDTNKVKTMSQGNID